MKTTFTLPEEVREAFLRTAREYQGDYSRRPERFLKKMRENTGSVAGLNPNGLDEEGMERKNPVIVALGDSVTAGHFEWAIPLEEMLEGFRRMQEQSKQEQNKSGKQEGKTENPPHPEGPIEITDAREAYHEKFRQMLIDEFEQTSVSVINAGIAGDTILGIEARLERDVLRYQPDLVLVNASLNWSEQLGSNDYYEEVLRRVIRRIKAETEADIILMTPNGEAPNPIFPTVSTLPDRVKRIRRMAAEEEVCLSDTYAIWEQMQQGYEFRELLANGVNHPDKTGHEVYALELMKLCH